MSVDIAWTTIFESHWDAVEDMEPAGSLRILAGDDGNCLVVETRGDKQRIFALGEQALAAIQAMNSSIDSAAEARGRRAGLEEAAKSVDPGDHPMCDCIRIEGKYWQQRCDCQNAGDLEIAQSWCVAKNEAAAIRALIDKGEPT